MLTAALIPCSFTSHSVFGLHTDLLNLGVFLGLLFGTSVFRRTRVSAAVALLSPHILLTGWKDAANSLRVAVLRGAGDDSGEKVTISFPLMCWWCYAYTCTAITTAIALEVLHRALHGAELGDAGVAKMNISPICLFCFGWSLFWSADDKLDVHALFTGRILRIAPKLHCCRRLLVLTST